MKDETRSDFWVDLGPSAEYYGMQAARAAKQGGDASPDGAALGFTGAEPRGEQPMGRAESGPDNNATDAWPGTRYGEAADNNGCPAPNTTGAPGRTSYPRYTDAGNGMDSHPTQPDHRAAPDRTTQTTVEPAGPWENINLPPEMPPLPPEGGLGL